MNFILKNENAQYFECGYSCDNAIFLSLGSERFFITDGRYSVEASQSIKSAEVIESKNLEKKARELMRFSGIKRLVYDPNDWSVSAFKKLSERLYSIQLRAVADFSPKKRIIKSDREIALLKKAVNLGARAFDEFATFIRDDGIGLSERALQYEAKRIFSKNGELSLSFEPIVSVNENAAKPHALPTKLRLASNNLLLVDAGVKFERYCSDRTRTALVSEQMQFTYQQPFSNRMKKVYDTVLKAHDMAIKSARSGMMASKIDEVAREIIDKAGYGKYFVHSTGHGVGLDIHEYPFISSKSDTVLEDNMVFTVEPGIYLPDEFGVRVEDMVVMQNGRAEII